MIFNKTPSAKVYGRSKDWLTELQKEKAKVPSPDKYEAKSELAKNPKMALNKSARLVGLSLILEFHFMRKLQKEKWASHLQAHITQYLKVKFLHIINSED